jgi:drug/metabolite transporter (DMT)-like permease
VLAIVLALGTSVSYGIANFLGPLLGRTHPLGAVLLVGQLAALAAAGALVVAVGEPPPPGWAIALGVLAGAGNALGLAAFLRATQLGPVAIASAIGALGTVVPVFVGLAGGESLSALQVAGVVLAVAGAALAAQRGSDGVGTTPAGVAWAVTGALGFGLLLSALPAAAEEGTAWALLDARIAVVLSIAVGVVGLRAPARAAARSLPALAAPGLLLLLGTLLYAEATARGALAVVSVLASLATVVTVALGFAVLGERLTRVQQVGVAAAVLGTVLLAV